MIDRDIHKPVLSRVQGYKVESFGDNFRALIIGASGGIGRALVERLQEESAHCVVAELSRSAGDFDLLDEDSIATQATAFAHNQFDLIVCATGALTIGGIKPEKSIRQILPDVMAAQFAINAIGPALLLKHFTPLLPKSKRSVFAILSARVGSIGDNRLGGWISYRSSKAALNQNDIPKSRLLDGDGTETEENRQLTSLLLANASRVRPDEERAATAKATLKTSTMECLLVIMFVPLLWIWKLTAGTAEADDGYY